MLWLSEIFLLFIFYSLLGYFVEIITYWIEKGKLVNRGFLVGPIIPIFGVGVMLLLWFLTKYKDDYLVVFGLGMLITGVLEYSTSYFLEKIFHNRWWDYSHIPANINGRVCLLYLILFGLAAVFIVCFFNPLLLNIFYNLSDSLIFILAGIIFLAFLADIIFSFFVAYDLRNKLIIVEELKNKKLAAIPEVFEKTIKKSMNTLVLNPIRLLKAFPDLLQIKEIRLLLNSLSNVIEERKLKKKNKKNNF